MTKETKQPKYKVGDEVVVNCQTGIIKKIRSAGDIFFYQVEGSEGFWNETWIEKTKHKSNLNNG